MKKWYLLSMLAILATTALAGYIQPAPVTIETYDDGSGAAWGDTVSARFANNDVEAIGCGTRAYSDGFESWRTGFCQATDADDNYRICFTSNPDLLDNMRATADYSFISFWWNSEGECVFVQFSTQSFYIPERVGKKSKKSTKDD